MHLSEVNAAARTGNVAALFDATVEHHGDALAIATPDRDLTHAELRAAAGRFAGGLRDRGYGPGDTLLLYLPNCPEYLVSSIGAFRAGVRVSPANPQYKTRELSYQLDDTGAAIVVTHRALAPIVADTLDATGRDPLVVWVGDATGGDPDGSGNGDHGADGEAGTIPFDHVDGDPVTIERTDDDVALLSYTSGTTGKPKGVRLTHRNVRAQLLSSLAGRDDATPDDEVKALLYLPLYHITGFTHTAMQPLVRGGALFVRDPAEWSASEAMATIEREGITHFIGVTAMYVDMVGSEKFGEFDLTSLVSVSEGGAKMSVAVQEEFERVASVDVSEGYGLTETNGATHTQQGSSFGLRHGTVGQPLRMVDCRIVDEKGREVPIGENGELLVRGPQVMDGYHDLPEATAAAFTEDGYFRTGDVARRDHENYYEIVDRKQHVIVTAGYNIYPSEVESLLAEHEAVAEAAVVGVPDDRRNEVPVAYVVSRPDVEPGVEITVEGIKQFCLESVAEYKHPREVHFVEELPRTASGKIRKFELAADDGCGADAG